MSVISNIQECSIHINELDVLKSQTIDRTDVEHLNASIVMLNEAVKNAPNDQKLALLKTALTVTLATFGILILVGTLAIPNSVGVGCLIVAGILEGFVSPFMWDHHEEKYGFHNPGRLEMPVLPPLGSIFHLESVYSVPSRLTKRVENLARSIPKTHGA